MQRIEREPGIGLVKCRGNEDQHQAQKRSEGQPIEKFENSTQSLTTVCSCDVSLRTSDDPADQIS